MCPAWIPTERSVEKDLERTLLALSVQPGCLLLSITFPITTEPEETAQQTSSITSGCAHSEHQSPGVLPLLGVGSCCSMGICSLSWRSRLGPQDSILQGLLWVMHSKDFLVHLGFLWESPLLVFKTTRSETNWKDKWVQNLRELYSGLVFPKTCSVAEETCQ